MPFLNVLSGDPMLRLLQIGLLILAVIAVFMVLFVTRDVLLRSRSFLFQFFSLLIAACLPILGFFLYLLIRPARTIKEREMEERLEEIYQLLSHPKKEKEKEKEPVVIEEPKRKKHSEE